MSKSDKTEGLLERLLKEMRIIFDSVPAWIFYKDKENRFIRVNKTFADYMNMSKEELEGKTMFELYPKELAESYWKDDKEVIGSGNPKLGIIESIETKKGMAWVQTDKIPYRNEKGEIIGIIGFSIDITPRKEIEEKLLKANEEWDRTFNAISDPIFILNKDSVIIKTNNAFLEFIKKDESEIIGKKCHDVVHNTNTPWPNCPFEMVKLDNKPHIETIDDPKLGVTLLVTVSPILDKDNKIIGAIHIAKDMTEQKNLESELHRKISSLEKFKKVTVGRELKMKELKSKIKGLETIIDQNNYEKKQG